MEFHGPDPQGNRWFLWQSVGGGNVLHDNIILLDLFLFGDFFRIRFYGMKITMKQTTIKGRRCLVHFSKHQTSKSKSISGTGVTNKCLLLENEASEITDRLKIPMVGSDEFPPETSSSPPEKVPLAKVFGC